MTSDLKQPFRRYKLGENAPTAVRTVALTQDRHPTLCALALLFVISNN